jgi:hypothetical protein
MPAKAPNQTPSKLPLFIEKKIINIDSKLG